MGEIESPLGGWQFINECGAEVFLARDERFSSAMEVFKRGVGEESFSGLGAKVVRELGLPDVERVHGDW